MDEWQIVDKSFSHEVGTVAGVVPKFTIWKRGNLDKSRPVFFCNDSLSDLAFNSWDAEIYGLLFESPAILPNIYDLVPTYIDKLTYLFTPNSDLLKAYPGKARFVPGGGIWNSVLSNSAENVVPEKKYLLSMMSSSKTICGLHQFRLNLANLLKGNSELSPHVFIQNIGDYIKSSQALDEYCYSIIIENHISENYFTEKILNCFAAGTVPIYFGAKHIDYFFEGNGILKFHSIETLMKTISSLSYSDWQSRLPSILGNMRSSKARFRCIEDYLWLHYANLLKK